MDANTRDLIKGFSINSAGYGIIPKLVMIDRDLHVTAKAIYAYFCSYTGAGDTCFPSRKKICYDLNIAFETFSKHLKTLITSGYIKVEQIKENGKFSHNLYTLCDSILPCTEKTDTENSVFGKLDTINNIYKNNSNNKNNSISIKKEIYKERNGEKWESENRTDNVDNANQSGGCHFQKGEGPLLKGGGGTSKSETYTENTTNNTTNIFLKKENLIKEKNQNEILSNKKSKNLTSGSQKENSDNNTGNICKKSINNGNSNNKEIVTNQKVDNNKGTLLITGENPKERKKNSAKRKKEGETFSSIIHSYTNNEEMQELLTEFIEIRAKIKRPLTPSSLKRNLKVLDRIALEDGGDGTDEEKIKIIERTVINSWQGFYSLKSSVYSSPVMKKVHQGGEQSNKKSGKLFDEPSYDISEYENWNPIEEHKHVNTLDEMLELKKAEKRQKYVDLEIKEND